jgi:hypothetical protein
MRLASYRKSPASLSYAALRRSVGIVALLLPFAATLPHLIAHGELLSSISISYYFSTRNVFVGSLCAIGLIMLCTRGYDLEDMVAGILSGVLAVLVANVPTAPDAANDHQKHVGNLHLLFAALLFLTLAYFCIFLFTIRVRTEAPTPKKVQRNVVYYVCGAIIILSLAAIGMIKRGWLDWPSQQLPYGWFFETTSLLAFGSAWLVKGEGVWFLND